MVNRYKDSPYHEFVGNASQGEHAYFQWTRNCNVLNSQGNMASETRASSPMTGPLQVGN